MVAPLNRIYIAVSLDGYVATADGGVAWLDDFQSEDFGYDEFVSAIGTIVMGRSTFNQVLGFGDWPYAGKHSIVVTSQPPSQLPLDTESHSGDIASLIGKLSDLDGGGVWVMGGATLIRAFLEHGAIDMMELFMMPRLLGSGVRLFEHASRQQDLVLASAHPYPSGAVKLTYTLRRSGHNTKSVDRTPT